MSLTNDDKQVLSQLHLDKCRACLADGEQLLEIDSVSAAANSSSQKSMNPLIYMRSMRSIWACLTSIPLR